MQWWLSIASIRLAVVCLLTWLTLRTVGADEQTKRSIKDNEKVKLSWIDGVWVFGATCSLIHMLAVFTYVHQWSHEAAVEDTARQTEELLGVAVGVGVYFNYLFNIVWILDALWILVSKSTYLKRGRSFDWLVYGFLLFIAFNGAVIFVSGWFRWFSGVMFAILIAGWVAKKRSTATSNSISV